jgi:hypothetical protein
MMNHKEEAKPDDNLVLAVGAVRDVVQWMPRTGRCSLLEAPNKCDYSIFRLGRDFTCRG